MRALNPGATRFVQYGLQRANGEKARLGFNGLWKSTPGLIGSPKEQCD
jgi:hypothetical protein